MSGRAQVWGASPLLRWLLLWAACIVVPGMARADAPEVVGFELSRGDDGLLLSFAVRFDLAPAVQDALLRGVPLYFVAQARVRQDRWYWRDRQIAEMTRIWRLTYQPLTRKFRVAFGGFSQNFDDLADALGTVRRVGSWRLADAAQIGDGGGQYVEFSYRLDTSLLPRPMQIGLGGQPEWTLLIEKTQRVR